MSTKEAPAVSVDDSKTETLPALDEGLRSTIESEFPTAKVAFAVPGRMHVDVPATDIVKFATFARDKLGFDHAESVTGVDRPADSQIEVVYHLGSYTKAELGGYVLAMSTRAPRNDEPTPGTDSTKLPSLRGIFYSVEFHEREAFEMLGVYFEGHPDNRRLLLPEDWADLPPMRKDFAIKGR